jgi:hypothetical protein
VCQAWSAAIDSEPRLWPLAVVHGPYLPVKFHEAQVVDHSENEVVRAQLEEHERGKMDALSMVADLSPRLRRLYIEDRHAQVATYRQPTVPVSRLCQPQRIRQWQQQRQRALLRQR